MSERLKNIFLLIITAVIGGCGQEAGELQAPMVADERPNILLIVADDLGYADLGVHGSDIQTPNIDKLAAEGILFTQFHTAPLCAPTRAMLLSGNNNHVAGMARQHRSDLAGHSVPGYEASLSDRIAPLPRLLRDAGYHTYTVGKWHLGLTAETSPKAVGFNRSFSLLDGAGSHFDDVGFSERGSTYWEDEDFAEYPVGRYSTEVYTDRLIEFIDSNKDEGSPFFAFAAYTSPHWPLQVPDDYLELYAGQYDDGYDTLRERNFVALGAAGIIPLESTLPPRNDAITLWEELSADEQRHESRKMELYAAMVDNLDNHIGRLLGYLKEVGLYENTLIVFMSDNGAAGEDFYNEGPFTEHIRAHFDNSYETMGTARSFVSYGEPWAEAGSAPFMRRKGYSREGGIVAPMIMAGRGVARVGAIDPTYVTVMDLAPTFLEIAGAPYPDDGSVWPMLGESMSGILAGEAETVHEEDYVTILYHGGRAYLRQGNWKIANLKPPFTEDDFELFDMSVDPGETYNLAESHPDKYEELLELWRNERKKLGIILPQDL
ncbi:MAG: arylsulfatase [Xanthomonadales bacterium]|nr:arylsulfatase [Gammaproteobacteria bacterium]NND57216.1 arylsulfatase [Xanthomonadales bacterium]